MRHSKLQEHDPERPMSQLASPKRRHRISNIDIQSNYSAQASPNTNHRDLNDYRAPGPADTMKEKKISDIERLNARLQE